MNLEDVQVFVAVSQVRTLTGAAGRLGLSKSIVSRRLARLENDLETRLVTRTARGVLHTEAGEIFWDHAVRLCAEGEAVRDALSPSEGLRGRLRIAAPMSGAALPLATAIAAFSAAHPALQIHTAYSDRVVDLVGEGFDVALRIGFLPDSTLMAQRLMTIEGRMVASPSYLATRGEPATPADLANHDLIALGSEVWPLVNGEEVMTIRPHARFTADSGQALAAAAVAGLGVALLPDFIADEHIAAGRLVVVMEDFPMPPAALFLVRPPAPRTPRKIALLAEFIRQRLC